MGIGSCCRQWIDEWLVLDTQCSSFLIAVRRSAVRNGLNLLSGDWFVSPMVERCESGSPYFLFSIPTHLAGIPVRSLWHGVGKKLA